MDGLAAYEFITHIAQCPVGGDVSVNKMGYGAKVGNDDGRPSRSDIYPRAVLLGLRQRLYGRVGYLMGLETHKCPVNVEE